MASEEDYEDLQTNQDRRQQKDHDDRELEPIDLKHKPTYEQLQEELLEYQQKFEESEKKFEESEKKINELQSQLARKERPGSSANQGASSGLSIASAIFRY